MEKRLDMKAVFGDLTDTERFRRPEYAGREKYEKLFGGVPELDLDAGPPTLKCPCCGETELIHGRVHVTSSDGEDAGCIVIEFFCNQCWMGGKEPGPVLVIQEHKGHTFLFWERWKG